MAVWRVYHLQQQQQCNRRSRYHHSASAFAVVVTRSVVYRTGPFTESQHCAFTEASWPPSSSYHYAEYHHTHWSRYIILLTHNTRVRALNERSTGARHEYLKREKSLRHVSLQGNPLSLSLSPLCRPLLLFILSYSISPYIFVSFFLYLITCSLSFSPWSFSLSLQQRTNENKKGKSYVKRCHRFRDPRSVLFFYFFFD